MGRGSLSNVDVSQRIRQFVFLVVVTTLGMIVGAALLGKGVHKSASQKTSKPAAAAASFK
jgi:hypothetical protein